MLRKDHQKQLDKVRHEQDLESRNMVSLLQRQNGSLESKCEKLNGHIKTLELRLRELQGIIESKSSMILEAEDKIVRTIREQQVISGLMVCAPLP